MEATSVGLTGQPRHASNTVCVMPYLVGPPLSFGWSTKPPSRSMISSIAPILSLHPSPQLLPAPLAAKRNCALSNSVPSGYARHGSAFEIVCLDEALDTQGKLS